MHRLPVIIVLLELIITPSFASGQAKSHHVPAAKKEPVSQEYFGEKVIDDYRWLEKMESPDARKWIQDENANTRSYLDSLPMRKEVNGRLKALMQQTGAQYKDLTEVGGRFFALRSDAAKEQPVLVVLKSADDVQSELTVVDPGKLNPKGTTAIDWFSPSPDGKLVAVCLSDNGSEDGTLHIFDTESGSPVQDVIPLVQYPTGGGSIAWISDGSGFYYTRYPHEGERPHEELHFHQQVYYHKLGTPLDADTYVAGKDFPAIAEIQIDISDGDRFLLISVANGDGGDFAHYVRDAHGRWTQLTKFTDKVSKAIFHNNDLFLLSRLNAPMGQILKLSLDDLNLAKATPLVPAGTASIEKFTFSSDRLYVVDLVGGPNQIRMFDLTGKSVGKIPVKDLCAVPELLTLSNNDVLYSVETYTEPAAYYRFNPATGQTTRTSLSGPAPSEMNDVEVIREFAISKDGTKVPLSIIRRKGIALNGQQPLLLYGYGGYNISLVPQFKYWLRMWLDQGGVYVEANIRGGGEFGDEWHSNGKLTQKQNVFDDFAASAKWLIANKYTNPSKFAIFGASNGGLLMGATLTQHPEMFRAVVSRVGIYDMLRSELSPNGAFNTTEFGSVKDLQQFKALYSYSPYFHVKDGVKYPAVLMTTGDNDGRVNPMQSRKMTARLQASTGSGLPVLFRSSTYAGHGMGTSRSEFLFEQTDIFTFLLDQLGMEFKPVP